MIPAHCLPLSPFVSHGMSGCWAEMMLLCLPLSPLVSHGMSGCWAEMMLLFLPLSPLVSHGMSGWWAEMILLCLPSSSLSPMACLDAGLRSLCFVSPFVSHGMSVILLCLLLSPLVPHGVSGCWAEMTLLCFPSSPLVSHGVSGCWAEIWRQEWIGQKRKLRLPLLFGVDAGVILKITLLRVIPTMTCQSFVLML